MFIYSKCFAGSSRKNVYTLPYAFIYQKSVYINIHIKPLCTAHFPAAGSNVHTHAYAFYFKKVHTLPYIPICRQQSEKEDKTQFCGQVKGCQTIFMVHANPIAGCRSSALALLLFFHYPHRAHNLPAIHPATAPSPCLSVTLPPLPRSQKQKKDVKILTIRCFVTARTRADNGEPSCLFSVLSLTASLDICYANW